MGQNQDLGSNPDSTNVYNELADSSNRETHTTSEYNSDINELENIKRPEKTIIRNLEVDTSKLFGIWAKEPDGPHADFWITNESFYVVDYDGNGDMPYILDKNKITIFYNDFIQQGFITSLKIDTLKIRWVEMDTETKYMKFKN